MTTELHDVPEAFQQTLELIDGQLTHNLALLTRRREEFERQLHEAADNAERIYQAHMRRLAGSLGIEVPDGAIVVGDTETWTLEVKSGRPGGGN